MNLELDLKMEEEDLKCNICSNFFKSPIRITYCGHDFCEECLIKVNQSPMELIDSDRILAQMGRYLVWPCPECKKVQNQKPEHLTRNFCLERVIEKFKGKFEIF